MAESRSKYLLIILSVLIILTGLSLINFFYGISEDYDGYFVASKAQAFQDDGYVPSRSWGFPAYEVIIYPIVTYLGIHAAKFYSLVFSLGSALVFSLILLRVNQDGVKLFWGAVSFVVLPVTIIASNTILETSQGVFFALLGLFFYMRYRSKAGTIDFYMMAVSLGFATSTRPDYIIFSAVIAFVVCMYHRPGIKLLLLGFLFWIIPALLPYTIYDTWHMSSDVVPADPFVRRLIRALFGIINLFGVFTIGLLTVWGITKYRRFGIIEKPLMMITGLTFILFCIRFVLLPDELEYIYILVPLLILFLMLTRMSRLYLILLAITLSMPNFIQIHLFERTHTGDLIINAGVSPGVIVQERNKRLLNEYRVNNIRILKQQIAENYGFSRYVGEPTDKSGVLVIIPQESLRYYRPERWGGAFYDAVCNQTVVVYPMPENRAWRQFIKFEDWQEIKLEDFREVFFPHCA